MEQRLQPVTCVCAGEPAPKVLHVQSISAWAPACIGPYGQAVVSQQLLHMAGQIGLDPASMQLVSGGLQSQASLVPEQHPLNGCLLPAAPCSN